MASLFDNMEFLQQQGLLGPTSERDAALQGLFALGNQIANRSAPRLDPTPPPLDLNAVQKAYTGSLQNSMRMGALAKKMKDEQALKNMFMPKTPAEEMVRTNAAKRARVMAERSFDKASMKEGLDMDATSDDFETAIQQKEVEFYPIMEKQAREALSVPDILSGLSTDEQRIMMSLGKTSPEAALKLLPNLMKAKDPKFDFKVVDKNLIKTNPRTGETEVVHGASNQVKPLSPIGKLRYDRDQNIISDEEFETGVTSLKRSRFPDRSKADIASKETGEYVGVRVFEGGKPFVLTGTGTKIPFDANKHIPTNRSFYGKNRLTEKQFNDKEQEIVETEIALGKLSEFSKRLGGTNFGFKRIADDFVEKFKTITGQFSKVKPEELNLPVARGLLQSLLGQMRVETVGPGVLTEQDAYRVIQSLGGNIDSLQNPDAVAAAIQRIFKDKLRRYNVNINQYNRQGRFRGEGFNPIKPRTFELSPITGTASKGSEIVVNY